MHRRISGAVGVCALVVPAFLALPAAQAASTGVMISEVYGGGGNSGATYTNDFVELVNAGDTGQDLTGWSVQYMSAAANPATAWQVTPLGGTVAADGTYLVQEAAGAGGTTPLPTPDATGSIPMASGAGTIALVNTTTALTCHTAVDCAADERIVDLVGYGSTAVIREGAGTAPNLSNTTSAARPVFIDTDNNNVDFTAGPPTPATLPPQPVQATIAEIQGSTHLSPLDGTLVTTEGVVTAVRRFGNARGYWLQDPTPDANDSTSEGIFAFTGSTTPALDVGDAVSVRATVDEFYPDGSPAVAVHPATTELVGPVATVLSTGNPLPAAEQLTPTTVPEAFAPQPGGSIENLTLQPTQYAMDFYESREGMLVSITDAHVVGASTSFNELFVTSDPNQHPTARGGTLYGGYDQQNGARMLVQSLIPFAQRPFPQVNVGDVLTGVTSGPVDYSSFGGYMIQATTLGAEQDNGLVRETTRKQKDNELAIATYNVENLSPVDPQSKFDELAAGIVTHLSSPDIVALEEIQDNTGPTNNGVVAADQTLQQFTDAIVAAGGPAYSWRQIDPVNNQDGGQPGGNIRVAFLYNPARVTFIDRPGGDSTTDVHVVEAAGHKPQLTVSPGRINPTSDAWEASRKPLVGEFVFNDKPVFVVANHFNSKGGDQPLSSRFQPPTRSSEIQRVKQAEEVRAFVDELRAVDSRANVVVLGDLNDFEFSPVLQILTAGGALTDLITTLPVNQRYTYVFQGNSQTLDHTLVGGRMKSIEYDVVHINAEFAQQASDHDPQIVRIRPDK